MYHALYVAREEDGLVFIWLGPENELRAMIRGTNDDIQHWCSQLESLLEKFADSPVGSLKYAIGRLPRPVSRAQGTLSTYWPLYLILITLKAPLAS